MQHDFLPQKTAVLLVQLGTPSQPTYLGLWRYLAEFLADNRVVGLPRCFWLPLLYGVILPLRSGASAKKYREIWTAAGSPLAVTSQQQLEKLQARYPALSIGLAMRYGSPSVESVLDQLLQPGINRLLVLPLYPQYAQATTASVFDAVSRALSKRPYLPHLHFIQHYADHPAYIDALAASVEQHWATHGRGDKLLISYHGIPKATFEAGDPYYCYCHKTTRLLAEKLGLVESEYQMVFQSRFGRAAWLEPYFEPTMLELVKSGCQNLDVICPGFAVDCLETLHEICIEYQAVFKQAGGQALRYIPALNATDQSIDALASVLAAAAPDCIT